MFRIMAKDPLFQHLSYIELTLLLRKLVCTDSKREYYAENDIIVGLDFFHIMSNLGQYIQFFITTGLYITNFMYICLVI